jgi:hypothetical protein
LCRIRRPFLSFPVLLLLGVALVVHRLALGQRDVDLHPPALVVQVQRHQREALLLDLADQAADLVLVHQQLLGAVGFGHHVRGRAAQRIDAAADHEQLAVADVHVAVGQLHLAGADGLDLPAREHDAGLEGLLDVVFMAGAAVLGNVGHAGGPGQWSGRRATSTIHCIL